MAHYRIENVTFERPARWRGATTACFFAPAAGDGPSPSITMWQEALAEGTSLPVHAQQMLVRLSREIAGFELAGTTDTLVGGRPAYVLRFRYADGEARSDQTMVIVAGGDADRAVTVFSTAARIEKADATRGQLFDLLKTVAFEGPANPVA